MVKAKKKKQGNQHSKNLIRAREKEAKAINQKDDLLKFVVEIQQRLTAVTGEYNIERELVMTAYALQIIPPANTSLWQQLDQLKTKLGTLYYRIEAAVQGIIETTIRASSVVENINSRLRPYFFLRKQFGQKALDLLRFFSIIIRLKKVAATNVSGKARRSFYRANNTHIF